MTKKEFLDELSVILNTNLDNIKEDDLLDKFEDWDSIAFLELSVLLENKFSIKIDTEKIKLLNKVQDILDLVKL